MLRRVMTKGFSNVWSFQSSYLTKASPASYGLPSAFCVIKCLVFYRINQYSSVNFRNLHCLSASGNIIAFCQVVCTALRNIIGSILSPEPALNTPLTHFCAGICAFPGHGNLSMLSLCMESECGLESTLRMPPRLWCGQQPPCPMANGGSSGPLLHRGAMGLKKKMVKSYLDIGDTGTTRIPERGHRFVEKMLSVKVRGPIPCWTLWDIGSWEGCGERPWKILKRPV